MAESVTPAPIQEPVSVDDNGGSLTVDGTVAVTEPVSVDDNGGSITVDGSVTVSGTVTIGDGTDNVDVLAAGADNVANTENQLVVAGMNYAYDGTTWDRVTNGGGTEATALRVTIANDSTGVLSIDDNGSSLTVDGSVTVTATDLDIRNLAQASDSVAIGDGTDTVSVLADGADNVGNGENQLVVAGMTYAYDGTTWDRVTNGGGTEATALRVTLASDSTGLVSVDDNGGSLTVDGTVTANQGSAGTAWEIVGDVAADVGVPANPVAIGGRASTAVPTAVSGDADAVYNWNTRQGAQVVTMAPHVGIFGSQPWNLTSKTAQYTAAQTSAVLVAGGASERLVVTSLQIQAFSTTSGTVVIYFGTGAYSRGTNLALFDGEFAPSATLKPGVVMQGPFISAANGDDILVTTVGDIDITVTVWYYVVT